MEHNESSGALYTPFRNRTLPSIIMNAKGRQNVIQLSRTVDTWPVHDDGRPVSKTGLAAFLPQ